MSHYNLVMSTPIQEGEPQQDCSFCLSELNQQGSYLAAIRLSSCGHTYCMGCVSILMRKEKDGGFIICPMCRVSSPIPQEVLESHDEIVLETLTTMAKRKKKKRASKTKESLKKQQSTPPSPPAPPVSFILRKARGEVETSLDVESKEAEGSNEVAVIQPASHLEEKIRNCLAELETLIIEWIDGTKQLIVDLEVLKDAMKKHHKNVQIACVSGHTTCAAGGVLCVAGAASAFFTFGTSLALTVAGTALAAAGNCTASGAMLVEWRLLEKLGKKADELFKEQAKRTSEIASKLHEVQCMMEEMINEKAKLSKGEKFDISVEVGTIVWSVGSMAYTVYYTGSHLTSGVATGLSAAGGFVLGGGATLMAGASALSVGLTVGGGVVTALFIPVNAAFAGWNAYKLHTGSLPKKAKALKGLIALLERLVGQVEEVFGERDFQSLLELFPFEETHDVIEESPVVDEEPLVPQTQPMGDRSMKEGKKSRKKKKKGKKQQKASRV